jgi:hypothetical protein
MKAAKKKAAVKPEHGNKGNKNAAKPVKRGRVIKFRVTLAQETAYKKQAKDADTTLSSWIVWNLPI